MKQLFPGFYLPTNEEFNKLWAEAIFVFDTNVLLNFYSYPEELRKVYFSVLSKLDSRLWIPYQVALEFHRNRFSKIKQENKRVVDLLENIRKTGEKISEEVKSIELEKRNIGVSDIDERLKAIEEAHQSLSDAVKLACDKLPPISLNDPIGENISNLFHGRVGNPPSDQAALEAMLHDAQGRYENKIPPGYADQRKGDASSNDRGVVYPDKYGDLILWRQMLSYAREEKKEAIVFVTNDGKKDWWWEEEGKTLGPLPQLVQEIADVGVGLFWMYSPDQFLQHAEKHLKATEVTPEAIKQVKELSDQAAEATISISRKVNPVIGGDAVLNMLSMLMQHKDAFDNYVAPNQKRNSVLAARKPAVSVEQDAESNVTEYYNRGILRIEVLRNTFLATGSGKLRPAMASIPFVSAKLEKAPEDYSSEIVKYSAGTGTNFDFNINMKSTDYDIPLPVGEYVFSYEAECFRRQGEE